LRLLAFASGIEHDDTLRLSDLRGGETDADGAVHRLQHVVHQPSYLGVNRRDWPRLDFEPGVGSSDDRKQSHNGF
jgi:hypothetical protein